MVAEGGMQQPSNNLLVENAPLINSRDMFKPIKFQRANTLWVQKLSGCTIHAVFKYMFCSFWESAQSQDCVTQFWNPKKIKSGD